MNSGPIVTLTTDFGTQDGYVGAMIGVVLNQCPNARVHHITHDVPPGDIVAGAWALSNAWQWFPLETVHVIVVDPGVGSSRREVLVRVSGHTFIAPDNGIVPSAAGSRSVDAVRSIAHVDARAAEPSATFHGRDVFASAAGWLCAGNDWRSVGPVVDADDLVPSPDVLQAETSEGDEHTVHGRVIVSDRFGNLVTTIAGAEIEKLRRDGSPVVQVDGTTVQFGGTFSDVDVGEAVAYIGSSGYLEIAINGGDASERFGNQPSITITCAAREEP